MRRPVDLSIGRIVLPASLRGQEAAFGDALHRAVGQRLQGGPVPSGEGALGRAVARTAAGIAERLPQAGGGDD